MNWPLVELGDVFSIARGGSPRPIDNYITDDPDGVNWVMIGDASNSSKFITETKKRIKPSGVSRSRMVCPGDFLLTNSMSFGRPYIMRTTGCIHDGWLVLSPKKPNVDHDYFYHLLGSNTVYSEFEKRAAGATVKNLNINLVKGVKVPLPPLDEQKRIAAILDQADALRRLRQRAIDRLNALGQAIFYEMFGDPATNPHGWPIGKIGDLAASTQYGTSAKAGVDGALPVLRMGNLTTAGDIELSDLKYIDIGPNDLDKYTVREGDILFNRTNSPELVGKTAVFYGSERMAFAGYLIRLRTNENARPQYISAFLNSPFGKTILRGMYKAIIGMANINATELREIAIPVPPVELQGNFARKVDMVRQARRPFEDVISVSDRLFSSLQHRAFTGQL